MALEMIKRYIKSIIYSVILLGLLGVPLSVAAQQELTREERIKILEQLKMEDIWGIERSGFFNGREKWAKGFENQRV